MSFSDAYLQTILLYRILPIAFLILVLRWVFNVDLSLKRINAKLQHLLLFRIHCKLDRQKKLLFDQLSQMNNNQSTWRGTNIRYGTCLLEIGIGSGRNCDFYPKGTLLTCLDPNPYNESYVMDALHSSTNKFIRLEQFVEGFAEDMSVFRDNSFDVVLCTLTLCTVRNQDAAMREIYRVLKPVSKYIYNSSSYISTAGCFLTGGFPQAEYPLGFQ